MKHQSAIVGWLFAGVMFGASTAKAVDVTPNALRVLRPQIAVGSFESAYSTSGKSVAGSVKLTTNEPFSSYGIRIALTLVNTEGVPQYEAVLPSEYSVQPHGTTDVPYSFSVPASLPGGSYAVSAEALSPSGEPLAGAARHPSISIAHAARALVLNRDGVTVSVASAERDISKSLSLDLNVDAHLKFSLPATLLSNVSVMPRLSVYRSVRPELGAPFKTVSSDKVALGPAAVLAELALPTDTPGLYYARLQLVDSTVQDAVVSQPIDFSYVVDKTFVVIGGLAVRSVGQYGPVTRVSGDATVNYTLKDSSSPASLKISLRDADGKAVRVKDITLTGKSGIIDVPFTFQSFGQVQSGSYSISAEIAGSNAISGSLPNKSGVTMNIMVALVLFALLLLTLFLTVRKRSHPRLAALAIAVAAVGLVHFACAPKALAADDYGQVNTTFSPPDGANLGTFKVCGSPDGSNFAANDSCKITVSGLLGFDSNYLQKANGSYNSLTYRYYYIETQVYVNGVLVADPFDPASSQIALSATGNANGNDLFSFTMTTHFTGQYVIKLIPHYYYYYNSCHGLFNENCTEEWWLSDPVSYTATVTPNAPALVLPASISNLSGANSVPLIYRSSGLGSFTLSDATGAPSYPKQIPISEAGNFSLIAGNVQIPVSRTPTQNLTATGQSISDAPNASSVQQLADPISLRQGDYQQWNFTMSQSGTPVISNFNDIDHPQGIYFLNKKLIRDPVVYPGDALDYSNAVSVLNHSKVFYKGGSFYYYDIYIPLKRYGFVATAPDDKLLQHCTSVTNAPDNSGMSDGITCVTTHQPSLNSGDSFLPITVSNQNQVTHKCAVFVFKGICPKYFDVSTYDTSQIVIRNFAGLARKLFPIDTTSSPVSSSTIITTGSGLNGSVPTANLTGPSTSIAAGNSIGLMLSLSNFSNSKSSGITISPASATITAVCAFLGASGGTCGDVQNPATDTTYTYVGWACDGPNQTGSCISSQTLSVLVTGSGSVSGSVLSYSLTPVAPVDSASNFQLIAAPANNSVFANSISFVCSGSDTPHPGSNVDGLTGTSSYSCVAPTNASVGQITLNTAANAVSGALESRPTLDVLVKPQDTNQVSTGTVKISSNYFCSGD